MNEMTWSEAMFQELTGYIYFIQMDRIGPVKVGFTKDVGKRLLSLQTGSPYPLNLLCVFPGNESMEKEIHTAFHFLRMDGEWFLPHPKLLKVVEQQKRLNQRRGFKEPNPSVDLGDWTLGGVKWKDHRVMITKLKRERWEKPEWQLRALADEYSKYAILIHKRAA